MVHRRLWLSLLMGLIGQAAFMETSWSAKKYYPPGYTPPAEQKPAPEAGSVQPPIRQVIIKTVPVVKPVHKNPLMMLMEEHRYFDALRLVDARLKKSPGNVSLQLIRGKILRDEGNFKQAAEQFQKIHDHTRIKTTRALALNGLGWTHYRKAFHDEQSGNLAGLKHYVQLSENAFKQALQLSPSLSDAWAGLGRASLLDKRVKDAETAIKRAVRLSPSGLQSQLAHAELLLAKKSPEEALQILYGLKKTTTHEPDVFYLLARGSFDSNRVDDAIINLKQLLEITPEHTAALKLLSASYERKMKPEDAEQVLQKAIAINPADERSVEMLLKLYEQRGEPERGVFLLSNLLKAVPEQAGYAVSLLSTLQMMERWEQAYEQGTQLVPTLLSHTSTPEEAKRELAHLFALAANNRARELLNNRPILENPAIRDLQIYLINRLEDEEAVGRLGLSERLDLLLVNPLTSLQKLPVDLAVLKEDLATAVQVACLSGDQSLYPALLKAVQETPGQRFPLAKALARLGDYESALSLLEAGLADKAETNGRENAEQLQKKLRAWQGERRQHLASIIILPRKVPASFFEKSAKEALRMGMGDWQTHAALAKAFEKRRAYELAYTQQLLAAHFAKTHRDRVYWQNKAEKTLRRIK